MKSNIQLLCVGSDGVIYEPVVEEGISWVTERAGSPGKLTFKVIKDKGYPMHEGCAVSLKKNNHNIFYGYIFSKSRPDEKYITYTCYDQLRYLKNKETYVYENKTAGEIIQMVASDFGLQTGTLEDTGYKIASRVEDSQTLFDIVQNALDITLMNTKNMYIFYDDFGKLTLKSLDSMQTDFYIDADVAEAFEYSSTIDEQTYNKIKLIYDNKETGQRDVYIAQDSERMSEWGVLQYYEKLNEGENGVDKVNTLLNLYNKKSRKLTVKNVLGSHKVRAGSLVWINLKLGDVTVKNSMLVESCTHTFKLDEHMMDLKLRGGEFIA